MIPVDLLYWAMQVYLRMQQGEHTMRQWHEPAITYILEVPRYNPVVLTHSKTPSWIPGNYHHRRGKR